MERFPIYSLFPNHTTSKINEHRENQITNLPRKLIQKESSRPSSKLAPIGTGRPSSNRHTSGQANPYLDAVRTSTIQTETRQFLTTSTHPIPGQIFSPFNQTQRVYQPPPIQHRQFYFINPFGIVPTTTNQQTYSYGSTISNVEKRDKFVTLWTPLPVDRLPKLFVSHGQGQSYTRNLERYVREKPIQGFNNNNNNGHLIIPQPLPANNAVAIPNQATHGFPRRPIGGSSGQVIHGLPMQNYGPMPRQGYGSMPRVYYVPMPRVNYGPMPRQGYAPMPRQGYAPMPRQGYAPMPRVNYGPMPRRDGGAMNIEGNNHNGNKQTMSAKQQIPKPDKETEGGAETQNSCKNKRTYYVFYNSNYGRQRTKNNNTRRN